MTRSVSFSGHATINATADNYLASKPLAGSASHKPTSVPAPLRMLAAAVNAVAQAFTGDWLTADMRRNMSPRSQRLMRADY